MQNAFQSEKEIRLFFTLTQLAFRWSTKFGLKCGNMPTNFNRMVCTSYLSNCYYYKILNNKFIFALALNDFTNIQENKHNLPDVTMPQPPYSAIYNKQMPCNEKIEKIQNYIFKLQYNHTGYIFFFNFNYTN